MGFESGSRIFKRVFEANPGPIGMIASTIYVGPPFLPNVAFTNGISSCHIFTSSVKDRDVKDSDKRLEIYSVRDKVSTYLLLLDPSAMTIVMHDSRLPTPIYNLS